MGQTNNFSSTCSCMTVLLSSFFFSAVYDSDEDLKKEVFDLSALPTAPRASRNSSDAKNLPSEPPFTAFLGNLPYDVEENDIIEFFGNLKVITLFSLKCFSFRIFLT